MRFAALVILALVACSESREARPFEAVAAQCKAKEMGCPRPIFAVRSLPRALAYYRDTLGFKVDWEWGAPADFASVTRGDATLFIGVDDVVGHNALWVFTRNVDGLYAELRAKGARIKMPPTNMPWGNRELHVLDADGNLLRFAGPAPH